MKCDICFNEGHFCSIFLWFRGGGSGGGALTLLNRRVDLSAQHDC
jgi:hypothetical protein